MTIPANLDTESARWGSIPVTPVYGTQGGPYTVVGNGNGLPVQGAAAAGSTATNPVLTGGVDASGNVQTMPANQELTLLTSATRTSTTTSANQKNYGAQGLLVFLNITAASGTGGLTLSIQGVDPVSGLPFTILVDSAAITATGQYLFTLIPGSGGQGRKSGGCLLPVTWNVKVFHGDSSNYTYSVGASTVL